MCSNMAFDNLYDLLKVDSKSSLSDIKSAYQQLVLQLHPDKARNSTLAGDNGTFTRVQEAWETLRDPHLRAQYDAKLAEQDRLSLALDTQQASSTGHVSDELTLDELTEEQGSTALYHTCRCGGLFTMPEHYTDRQLDSGIVLSCDSCSLRIKVTR